MDWIVHIVGVVLWVGGLLAAAHLDGLREESAAPLRGRLLKTMALPGLVLALLGGVGLAVRGGHAVLQGGWFHTKLLAVALLIVVHVLLVKSRARGAWPLPAVGLLALAAVLLAHLKPF
jgi:uncharacterized membrane protein